MTTGLHNRAPDQDQRDRIHNDLDTTLFVEAGAGSGKTTALVDRIVSLVVTGTAELRHIAAITFTDKAAAELRDRVRQALEQASAASGDAGVKSRCDTALDQLDGAAIGTLHAFAQRLLVEHPLEAGLPPRVEVLDEVSSGIAFEERWATYRDELLDDPALERTLLLLFAAEVRHEALRALALEFDRNWDLVEERVPAVADDPPPVRDLLEDALVAAEPILAARKLCTDSNDLLCVALDDLADTLEAYRQIDDELELIAALSPNADPKLPTMKFGNKGKGGNWLTDLPELRRDAAKAGEALAGVHRQVAQACARRVGAAIRAFTLRAADERRRAGELDFHDLLVVARGLLRHPDHGPAVRAQIHQRYQRLLLDEFQDTDPIQIELAVRIAAADPAAAAASDAPWHDVPVAAGQLFVVGDPKQSIYRFRRADIATFLTARNRFGPEAGGPVSLTANFRTVEPVIDWVNTVFGALLAEAPELDHDVPSQPAYVDLTPVRAAAPSGPAVAVLGPDEHPDKTRADDLRAAEAADVVATVLAAIEEGWAVADKRAGAGSDAGSTGWRPARLGDITILVPARTSLPFLEDALDQAGIPFRAEASSLVYATRAVRDLLMVLRAVDDPTDHLRVAAALRTPLLACGDDDLFRYKVEQRGSWNYLAEAPDTVPADSPVRLGLAFLADLHRERQWRAPSELLGRIARERRAMELGFAEGRPRDVWRRLRFVIDQARAWSEATGGSLRQYLLWVDRQSAEGARVAEAVLPETDDDAVRIMTIHAAKGLEFPITIVSGMSTAPQSRPAPAQVVFPPDGSVGYKFGRVVTTDEYEAWKPVDEQMGYDERVRLLYVACTRAEDHLVVSLHRRARRSPPAAKSRTNAEMLVVGMGTAVADLPVIAASPEEERAGAATALTAVAPAPPVPLDQWRQELASALEEASRPSAVAATALTDEGIFDAAGEPDELGAGLDKRPRDLDLPPWLKGRYGTAVGRAVHAVLQTIDLAAGADGPGVDAAVAAQCQAEAIPERATDVRRLVNHALASPSVTAAARAPHWREVYACTPMPDGRLLEGYIDLLYRSEDGLIVVDYKTASTRDPAELARRVEGYTAQGRAYATAVGAATGETVAAVVFVFLTNEGAVEMVLP